ncbi:hypothetical protein CVT24_002569 [Panaeolus cyanescens]|uniref:Ecp2 effector protein-like domain-containing protein n=1 Tax=Panaeolus cyanescens TaxID=181874 RepID=A0A409YU24_9AGAR|nr:hypothetical protein CVT24_002569 [Panaeolus cyanescens]
MTSPRTTYSNSMVKLIAFPLLLCYFTLTVAVPAEERHIREILPYTLRRNTQRNIELESPGVINKCGSSSFISQTNNDAPLVVDCERIVQDIEAGGPGIWAVALKNRHQVVQYGTCGLRVHAPVQRGISNYLIGKSDLADVIKDSISRFQASDKVGARGSMPCQRDPKSDSTIDVEWEIYHT